MFIERLKFKGHNWQLGKIQILRKERKNIGIQCEKRKKKNERKEKKNWSSTLHRRETTSTRHLYWKPLSNHFQRHHGSRKIAFGGWRILHTPSHCGRFSYMLTHFPYTLDIFSHFILLNPCFKKKKLQLSSEFNHTQA